MGAGASAADCIWGRRNAMSSCSTSSNYKASLIFNWCLKWFCIFHTFCVHVQSRVPYLHYWFNFIVCHWYFMQSILFIYFVNIFFSLLTMMPHGFKSSKQDFTFGPWKVTASTNHIMKSKDIERWSILEAVVIPQKSVILNKVVILNLLNKTKIVYFQSMLTA